MQPVPFYAALLGLLFVALSVRTLRLRRSLKVAVGDGGSIVMLRAMRVHANFAEYVPLALVLLYLLQAGGAAIWLLHMLGIALVLGRVSHALGVSRLQEDYRFRVAGMAMTLGMVVTASAWLLVTAFVTH